MLFAEDADMADDLDPDSDCFKPPPGSMLVHCIHCDEEYESFRIEWRVFDGPQGKMGFWCCPIEGCDGKGFGFDIFPVDRERAEQCGIVFWDDDEEEDSEEEWDDLDPPLADDSLPSDDSMPPDEDIPF